MYIISLIILIFIYKYILVVLIIIELLILNLSLIIYIIFNFINLEIFIIYYLVFRVCEGVLGLGLLVLIVRFHGNELYFLFHINKF